MVLDLGFFSLRSLSFFSLIGFFSAFLGSSVAGTSAGGASTAGASTSSVADIVNRNNKNGFTESRKLTPTDFTPFLLHLLVFIWRERSAAKQPWDLIGCLWDRQFQQWKDQERTRGQKVLGVPSWLWFMIGGRVRVCVFLVFLWLVFCGFSLNFEVKFWGD